MLSCSRNTIRKWIQMFQKVLIDGLVQRDQGVGYKGPEANDMWIEMFREEDTRRHEEAAAREGNVTRNYLDRLTHVCLFLSCVSIFYWIDLADPFSSCNLGSYSIPYTDIVSMTRTVAAWPMSNHASSSSSLCTSFASQLRARLFTRSLFLSVTETDLGII